MAPAAGFGGCYSGVGVGLGDWGWRQGSNKLDSILNLASRRPPLLFFHSSGSSPTTALLKRTRSSDYHQSVPPAAKHKAESAVLSPWATGLVANPPRHSRATYVHAVTGLDQVIRIARLPNRGFTATAAPYSTRPPSMHPVTRRLCRVAGRLGAASHDEPPNYGASRQCRPP